MKCRMWALLIVVGLLPLAHAGIVDDARKAAAQQSWSAWGGDMGFRWNRGLLGNLGVKIEPAPTGLTTQSDRSRHEWFALRESGGLNFIVKNGSLQSFSSGSLQMRGGYRLRLPDGSALDLRELTLRVRPTDPRILDAVSGDGKVWFYSDRIMFELANNKHVLAVRAADLRIAPALATRLGKPDASGWEVADIAMNTQVFIQGADEPARVCSPYPWPGVPVPGTPTVKYQADLFMQSLYFDPVDCMNCTGGGSTDGIVAVAPTSQLRNNVNDGSAQATVPGDPLGTSSALYTANIAWYTKFTGSPPSYNPPYKNDQHPFLIWNLYRINADGSIEQIGRSGVKHAFLTINAGCSDSCYDSHSLGLGCSDTYGSGNNDSPSDMGPRSEIVPASGTWGRCGSIFDPNCTGNEQNNGNDSWTQRLKTHESQINPATNAGASYLLDSWYIARDDINIYNSMATLTGGTPHWDSSQWSFPNQANFRLGAAIDRWVSPTAPPANAMNTEVAVSEGHAKLAVKATDTGGGNWRYDYAVMNLDFARAVIQEAPPSGGPDPHVVSNRGFDSFSVPLPAGATVSATHFSDGDLVAANDWTVNVGSSSVTWTAPASGPTLDWGTLYSFSVTVNAAPVASRGTLHVAQSGTPANFEPATLAPTVASPQSGLTIAPSSLAITVVAGASANSSFSISNSGDVGTTLNYTIDVAPFSCASPAAVAWLSAAPSSGSVAQGAAAATITATANAASVAAGSYSAQICVHSDDPAHPLVAVPVALTVTAVPVPAASLSPASFTFTAVEGASASGTLSVANNGASGTTLQFTITASDHMPVDCAHPNAVAWLGAIPASGSVNEGAQPAAVTVQGNAIGLAPGTHTATLCVGSNDAAHPMIEVPVSLISLDPNDVIFIDGFDGAH